MSSNSALACVRLVVDPFEMEHYCKRDVPRGPQEAYFRTLQLQLEMDKKTAKESSERPFPNLEEVPAGFFFKNVEKWGNKLVH